MGAPIGNQNASKAKRWSAAIERAVEAYPNPPDVTGCTPLMIGLNNAAHQFVHKMMIEGDVAFFREFGDRIEGKVAQAIAATLSNPDGTGLFSKAVLEVVAVDNRSA